MNPHIRHTYIMILLSAASIWQVCGGHIKICKEQMMTENGATIYSTVGGRITIEFQVVSDRDIYRYLKIDHPNLCGSSRGWYAQETEKLVVAMTTTEVPKTNKYRTIIVVTVKHLEQKDFSPDVPFLLQVFTVTSERLPNVKDSVQFTFRLLERVECSRSEKGDNGTCDKGWRLIRRQCVRVFGKSTWADAYSECEKHGGEIIGNQEIIISCVDGDIPKSLKSIWMMKRTTNECYMLVTGETKNKEQLENCSIPQFFLCGKDVKGPVQLCQNQVKVHIFPATLGESVNFSMCLVSYSSPYVIETFRNQMRTVEGLIMSVEITRIRTCHTHYIMNVRIDNVRTQDYGLTSFRIRNGYGDLVYNVMLQPPDWKPPLPGDDIDDQAYLSGDYYTPSGNGDDFMFFTEGNVSESSTTKEEVQPSTKNEVAQTSTQNEVAQTSTQNEVAQISTQNEVTQTSTQNEVTQTSTQKGNIQSSTQRKGIQSFNETEYIQLLVRSETIQSSTQKESNQSLTGRDDQDERNALVAKKTDTLFASELNYLHIILPACLAIMIVTAAVITAVIYKNREKLYRQKTAAISPAEKY